MTSASPPSRPRALVALILLSAAQSALAIFQWVELYIVRTGGHAVCGINDTFNCETVWNSRGAGLVHDVLGVPIAALGLVWGLSALCVSVVAGLRAGRGQAISAQSSALKLFALVGLLACAAFGFGSLASGSWCITCLGTYALVASFAFVALRLLPGALLTAGAERNRALLWTVAPVFAMYVAVLGPGLMTPHAVDGAKAIAQYAEQQQRSSTEPTQPVPQELANELNEFIERLPSEAKQMLSNSLADYKASVVVPPPPARVREGPADAAVRIVEFTDIRCPHCRLLLKTLKQLEQAVPAGRISIEARNFPLDSECNPLVPMSDGTHVRCLGAKAQICLEGAPDYWELREKMFDAQETLTEESLTQIAASGSVSRVKLDECLRAAETTAKLQADISYAQQYHPTGTPIVLLNERTGTAIPQFLYALTLSGGRTDVPAFANLPPPRKVAAE